MGSAVRSKKSIGYAAFLSFWETAVSLVHEIQLEYVVVITTATAGAAIISGMVRTVM
jgi:hypothetical protein